MHVCTLSCVSFIIFYFAEHIDGAFEKVAQYEGMHLNET